MLETLQHLRIRYPRWIIAWGIFFSDALFSFLAFFQILIPAFQTATNYNTTQMGIIFIVLQSIYGLIFLPLNLYKSEATTSRFYEIQQIVKTTFLLALLAVLIHALRPGLITIKPQTILKYWLLLALSMSISRWVFRSVQKYLLTQGVGLRKTIIVGMNQRGYKIARDIQSNQHQGFNFLGFVCSDDDPLIDTDQPVKILGEEIDLKNIILENQVSEVILAPVVLEHTHVTRIITRANGSPVSIKIVPDLYEVISGMARTEQIFGIPLIRVNPNLDTVYNTIFKRLLDFGLSLIIFILTLPLWLLIALCIKLDSRGPVFYFQERIGKNHEHFFITKFRTMIMDAEKHTGPVWAKNEDPRITRVGKFLRRFRLDELPQLLMVIKGNMSLIGPRPERPFFVDQLLDEYPFYYRRHKIRPGISGWAQIKHPYDQDIDDVRQKLKYDFYYIENLSFSLDLKIMISTIWVMLSGEGR